MTAKEKNKLSGEDLKRAIKTACHGLVFISEIDADVRPVFIEKKDASTVDNALALLTGSEKMTRTERRPDDFFLPLTSTRDWHGSIENARVRRFRDLQELLFENLTGLRQYRLGKTRLTIYVIGYDHDGNIVGITTEAVET